MKTIEFITTDYASDLTDTQWDQIAEFFPQGPNSDHHNRSLINGVPYLVDNDCKWRNLPHDYPPCSTVHTFCRRARLSGLWEKVLQVMAERTRLKAGREATPSYGIIDSQGVKTVYASDERGMDGGKNERPEAAHSHGHHG